MESEVQSEAAVGSGQWADSDADDLREQALRLRQRGRGFRAEGLHAEALAVLAEAENCAVRAGDALLAAQTQIGAVDSLGMLGRHGDAVALAGRLAEQLESLGASVDAARVRSNLGNIHFRNDRYADALACFQEAEPTIEDSGDVAALAVIRLNTANALTHLNRLDEAMALYSSAREGFESVSMAIGIANAALNVGYLHQMAGRYLEALACLQEAFAGYQSLGLRHEAARCDIDLAEVYRSLNLNPEALACSDRAIEALDGLGIEYDVAKAEMGRAVALSSLGRDTEAGIALDQAETVFRLQRNEVQRAHVHLARSYLAERSGDTAYSRRLARSACRRFRAGSLDGWAAEARFQDSRLQAKPSIRSLLAIRRAAQTHHRPWLACRVLQTLAQTCRSAGRHPEALKYMREAANELENVALFAAPDEIYTSHIRDKTEIVEELVAALMDRGRPADHYEAFEQIERFRARNLLERLSAGPPRPMLASVRAALADGEALLEYATAGPSLYAFVVRGGPRGGFSCARLCEVRIMEQAVRALRFQLHRPVSSIEVLNLPGEALVNSANEALRRLYDLVFHPIEQTLAGASRVTIVPAGALHAVPFHALFDGHEYLLDRLETTIAPSSAVWLHYFSRGNLHGSADNSSMLLIGAELPGLRRIPEEISGIAERLQDVRLLTGVDATVSAAKERLGSCRFAHIAAHALFRSDNPLYSGIRLADGWLLVRDLVDIRIDCELVTLSACETAAAAVQPGEETLGIARAFLAAGARAVCASLWPADDRSTAELMVRFYRKLTWYDRPSEALRTSQIGTRELYQHPYYWAAFTLIGTPTTNRGAFA